jgi:hypothetical protein
MSIKHPFLTAICTTHCGTNDPALDRCIIQYTDEMAISSPHPLNSAWVFRNNAVMNDPQPVSPRRRLQILLAIPDNQKTEAEWEEINELEITLAPGNRMDSRDQEPRRSDAQPMGNSRPQGGNPRPQGANPRPQGGNPKPAGGGQARKPFRKFKKKPTTPEGV